MHSQPCASTHLRHLWKQYEKKNTNTNCPAVMSDYSSSLSHQNKQLTKVSSYDAVFAQIHSMITLSRKSFSVKKAHGIA